MNEVFVCKDFLGNDISVGEVVLVVNPMSCTKEESPLEMATIKKIRCVNFVRKSNNQLIKRKWTISLESTTRINCDKNPAEIEIKTPKRLIKIER